MSRRFPRYVRNILDLLTAWVLWAPNWISKALALSTGVRLSTKDRFADRAFAIAMRLKFYRSAVEIYILSRIDIPEETLLQLFDQCLNRGYFGRACILAPYMKQVERSRLYTRLMLVGEKILADHIALLYGMAIDPHSAERTASLFQTGERKRVIRSAEFAKRTVAEDRKSSVVRRNITPSTRIH